MTHFVAIPDQDRFFERVWAWVRLVPPGKVTTYGQIASLVDPPAGIDPVRYRAFGARWVGSAMANCPPDVPWQRVVNAQGQPSLAKGAGERQRQLLQAEGVVFSANGKIDLRKFGWDGKHPDQGDGDERIE